MRFGRGQERIKINFGIQAADDEVAEADEQLLEGGQVHRRAAAHAFQGGVDFGLLHHPSGEGGVQRRQGQGAVLVNLDQLAARAEEQHRAELRVHAAADDDFIAVELDHGLDGDALEMFFAGAFGDGGLDGAPGALDRGRVLEVELERRPHPFCG